jgi:hypothetical protein
VKSDGSILKTDLPASVGRGTITTFVTEFPIEVGDHFLRNLPNGLVEDYVVDDPRFSNGIGPIPANYQIKVHRSNAPTASPHTVIANFLGSNSRMNDLSFFINNATNTHYFIVMTALSLNPTPPPFSASSGGMVRSP